MSRSFRLSPLSRLGSVAVEAQPSPSFGDGLDLRLGASLAAGLHEAFAAPEERGPGLGFAVMLALRARTQGPILWVRESVAGRDTRLNGWGLSELGCDPARLLLVETKGAVAMLRAAREAMSCAAVAAVIMESQGCLPALDLTATRRLHLAAVEAGVLAVSLRHAAEPAPSAALTRWQVAAAPSSPLAALAPGLPRLALTLLRRRGGLAGLEILVEWDRDRRAFSAPGKTHSGAVPAALPGRAVAASVAAIGRRAA